MNTLQTSAAIALVSFTIGTLLFFLQLVNFNMVSLPILGLYYLFLAVVVNLVVLLVLVIKFFIEKQKTDTLKSMGIILANAPIASFYAYILFEYSFI